MDANEVSDKSKVNIFHDGKTKVRHELTQKFSSSKTRGKGCGDHVGEMIARLNGP